MKLIENATAEKLRGGFYTPEPIAEFILRWGTNGSNNFHILEPSCGDGVFLEQLKNLKSKAADFDIIAINPLKAVQYIKYELKALNILNVNYVKHDEVGEIIPVHYELKIGKETIAFIYEAKACYSYNEIYSKKENANIKVATIDTILYFYLSFLD